MSRTKQLLPATAVASALAMLLALTACEADVVSDEEVDSESIVGGRLESGYPATGYLVAMRTDGQWESKPFCTATLIYSDIVVTAAHCITRLSSSVTNVGFGTGQFSDRLITRVVSGDVHPAWDPATEPTRWDLAVLRLAYALGDRAPALIRRAPPENNCGVTVIGYGQYTADPRYSTRTLRKSGAQCVDTKTGGVIATTSDPFITTQSSVCYGDSGGALMRSGTNEIVGVTSKRSDEVCTTDDESYFASIWSRRGFIGCAAKTDPVARSVCLYRIRQATRGEAGFGGTGTIQTLADGEESHEPIGFLDVARCDVIQGWAMDLDDPDRPLTVQLLADGTPFATITAGDSRSDLCDQLGYCNHAFTLATPASLRDGHRHVITALAIDTDGLVVSPLGGSGMAIECASGGGGTCVPYGGGCTASTVCCAPYNCRETTSGHFMCGQEPPPPPPPPTPPPCGVVPSGGALAPGQSVTNCAGTATLVHQGDGNVVVYDQVGALWWTGIYGPTSSFAMQGDGNLVLYGPYSNALWSSGTFMYGGSWLVLQDDCNLVIYTPYGAAVWATMRFCRTPPPACACTPGTSEYGGGCGNCNYGTARRDCGGGCQWGGWYCSSNTGCTPGTTAPCGPGQEKYCWDNCTWSGCYYV